MSQLIKTEMQARTLLEEILSEYTPGFKYAGSQRQQNKNEAAQNATFVYVVPVMQNFDTLVSVLEDLKLNTNMSISFIKSDAGIVHGLMEQEIIYFLIELK